MEIDEIARLKDKCIQEEPPYCSAACPVHVDFRLLMHCVQQSDFDKAYTIHARKVLFPGTISRVCDQPCRRSCTRNKLDDPLSIGLVERATVDLAEFKDPGICAAPGNNRRVMVVGGGLTGMCCALDLARKGYTVALHERSGRLGGKLREIDFSVLPPEVLEEDVRRLEDEDIEINLSSEVTSLDDLEYDACFVAAGGEDGGVPGALPKDESGPEYPITFESTRKGVFVVPSQRGKERSPILAVLQGMRHRGKMHELEITLEDSRPKRDAKRHGTALH